MVQTLHLSKIVSKVTKDPVSSEFFLFKNNLQNKSSGPFICINYTATIVFLRQREESAFSTSVIVLNVGKVSDTDGRLL